MSQSIRELVESQVQEKIAKGEALAASIEAAEAAQATAEARAREVTTARRDALAAGWTEGELKRLGLAGGRAPRARKQRSTAGASEPAEVQTTPAGY